MRPIWVVYRRPLGMVERSLQGCMPKLGAFLHCEVYCPDLMHDGAKGCTYTNFSACPMLKTRECLQSYSNDRALYSYHMVEMDETQFETFTRWNDKQINNSCKYNYTDLLLQIVPFASTIASEVDTSRSYHKSLYCSQAVILALRASLNPDHKIVQALKGVVSRVSTPSSVSDLLSCVLGKPKPLPSI